MRYFIQLLKHDIREQIWKHWYYFVFVIPLVIYLSIDLKKLIVMNEISATPQFMDIIIRIFYGVEEYVPQINPFMVDMQTMFIHIILAYIIAYYPVKDLSLRGRQVFIRVGKNAIWWYSKCVWLIVTILIYYAIIYLTAAIMGGGFNLILQPEIIACYGTFNYRANTMEYVLYCMVLPIAASLAVSFLQMLLSVMFAPVYGFLAVILEYLMSCYFYSSFLPGNYRMFNRIILGREDGITAGVPFALCIAVVFLCVITGSIYIRKKDIL